MSFDAEQHQAERANHRASQKINYSNRNRTLPRSRPTSEAHDHRRSEFGCLMNRNEKRNRPTSGPSYLGFQRIVDILDAIFDTIDDAPAITRETNVGSLRTLLKNPEFGSSVSVDTPAPPVALEEVISRVGELGKVAHITHVAKDFGIGGLQVQRVVDALDRVFDSKGVGAVFDAANVLSALFSTVKYHDDPTAENAMDLIVDTASVAAMFVEGPWALLPEWYEVGESIVSAINEHFDVDIHDWLAEQQMQSDAEFIQAFTGSQTALWGMHGPDSFVNNIVRAIHEKEAAADGFDMETDAAQREFSMVPDPYVAAADELDSDGDGLPNTSLAATNNTFYAPDADELDSDGDGSPDTSLAPVNNTFYAPDADEPDGNERDEVSDETNDDDGNDL